MRQAQRPLRHRAGFTLVELLVSMALIIFIMALMSDAFTRGLEAFRTLKAIGDMQEKLRSVTIILRRDLTSQHFDNSSGRIRLSDEDLRPTGTIAPPGRGFFRIWQGSSVNGLAYPQPPGQYFYYQLEGRDDNYDDNSIGLPSYRATDQILHFTVRLEGYRRQDYLTARAPSLSPLAQNSNSLLPTGQNDGSYYRQDFWEPPTVGTEPAGTYVSQWAEVAYFLRDTKQTAGTTPLFALYRRQRLALTPGTNTALNSGDHTTIPPPTTRQLVDPNYFEVSCDPDQNLKSTGWLYFNGPDDLTIPERRFAANQSPGTLGMPGAPDNQPWNYPTLAQAPWPLQFPLLKPPAVVAGDDLLLTNVISFEIKALWDTNYPTATGGAGAPRGGVDFQGLDRNAGVPTTNANSDPNLNLNTKYLGAGVYVFDTWTIGNGDTTYPGYSTSPSTWSTPGQYCIPAKIRVRGLQITIRVWDVKTKQARQVTIVQDM